MKWAVFYYVFSHSYVLRQFSFAGNKPLDLLASCSPSQNPAGIEQESYGLELFTAGLLRLILEI